jgi:hypothetical protein
VATFEEIATAVRLLGYTCPGACVYLPNEDYDTVLKTVVSYTTFVNREAEDPEFRGVVPLPEQLREGITLLGVVISPVRALEE